jgi:hypothetical protein
MTMETKTIDPLPQRPASTPSALVATIEVVARLLAADRSQAEGFAAVAAQLRRTAQRHADVQHAEAELTGRAS